MVNMNSNSLIIFTHIPKTAGTSFLKTVVEPNIPESQIYHYGDIKKFFVEQHDYTLVEGHVPYGLHYFTNRPVKYITFLRNPIERAVSYYYFIKDSDVNVYKHPLRDYADSVSLKEFYENKKFQNQQTRFLAGFLSDRLYAINSYLSLEKVILDKAVNHLLNYYCFGILERFEQSIALFQERLEWPKTVKVAHQKKTNKRPKLADLDKATLHSLKEAHILDLYLYDFAVKYFDDQYSIHNFPSNCELQKFS
jgi:hypothetical protein